MSEAATREQPLDSVVAQLADEFLEALARGERPDADAYARRHPQHEAVVRQVLASLRLIRLSAGGSGGGPADADPEPLGCLGDFRLVRPVGRGGMGVVYEAEQISLGRRVALKVLPFAAAMDGRRLQRFRNEAQAAAQLHHSNIVPVYQVGCERGVHFYAMQFIDGQSLAAVIHGLREGSRAGGGDCTSGTTVEGRAAPDDTPPAAALPTDRAPVDTGFYRSAAGLGAQAAEALEYAHQTGVLHRDVKPANLMVDGSGRLWVTDFGLAQIRSDTRLTLTGDLVGTLRYMSPEQALAKRVVVDHRTDVYSLGATLYELLTLEPAFGGEDRQELLRQIAFDEPAPLRRVNRSVPAELEVVVLKALAKNPAERYATAQELADDLRRWLDHRPVLARRPTAGMRGKKWAWRHRTAVTTAAAFTAVLLLVTIGLLAFRNWEMGRKNRTIERKTEQVEREQEKTKAALAEAKASNERMRKNLNLSMRMLDELFLREVDERFPGAQDVDHVDR